MTTNKPELVLDEFYNAEFPRHERTSCSDEDPSNASPDGFGCKRCNAIIHVRAERLQAECEQLRCIISDLKDWDCDVSGGFLSLPLEIRRRMQVSLAAHRSQGGGQ